MLVGFFIMSFNQNIYASLNEESKVDELPVRQSSRLIILDSEDRLLLMQIKLDEPADPLKPITKPYWVTLGGGVNSNESLEEAAVRELYEETGITDAIIGPRIWHGQWQGKNRINDETYFLIKLNYLGGELNYSNLEEEEKQVIKTMKWWTIDELKESTEIFIPQYLSVYLTNILKGEIPSDPIEIDLSTPKENI